MEKNLLFPSLRVGFVDNEANGPDAYFAGMAKEEKEGA